MALMSSKSLQGSSPSFPGPLEETFCRAGQDAVLECVVHGQPIPEVRWEKGGIQLATTRRLRTERQGDKCRLHIKSCTRLETGLFKCIASNKFGSASTSANVRFDVVPQKDVPISKKESTANVVQEKAVSSQKDLPAAAVPEKVVSPKNVFPVVPQKDVPTSKKGSTANANHRGIRNGIAANDDKGSKLSQEKQSKPDVAIINDKKLPQVPLRPKIVEINNGNENFKRFPLRKVPKTEPVKTNTNAHVFRVPSLKRATGLVNTLKEDSKASQNVNLESLNGSLKPVPNGSKETKPNISTNSEPLKINGNSKTVTPGSRETKPNILTNSEPLKINGNSKTVTPVEQPKPDRLAPTSTVNLNGSRTLQTREPVSKQAASIEPKINGNRKTQETASKTNRVPTTESVYTNGKRKTPLKDNSIPAPTTPLKKSPNPIMQDVPSGETKKRASTGRQRKQVAKFVLSPKSKVVKEGEEVKFMCSTTGNPEPKVTWKRRDVPLLLPAGDDRFLCYQTDCMHILEIRDVQASDADEYTALVDNEMGSNQVSVLLEVRARNPRSVAPRVIRPLSDLTVPDGTSCLLSCEVSGSPTPSCRWRRTAQPLVPHPDFTELFDGQTASLSIREVYPDDEGTYTLVAENSVGKVETSCKLAIKRPQKSILDEDGHVPIFTSRLTDLEVGDGSHLVLSVEVSGSEPMEIVWVHNEHVIKDSPDFKYSSSEDRRCHSLVIEEVFPEDAGIYFCEAYNLFGEDVTTCMIKVKGPGDPSNFDTDLGTSQEQKSLKCEQPMEELLTSGRCLQSGESLLPALEDAKVAFRQSLKENSKIQEGERHRLEMSYGGTTSSPRSALVPDNESSFPTDLSTSRRPSNAGGPRLSPARILKGPRSLAVLRGETITLRCQISGAPFPAVSWIRAGKILSGDERVTLEVEEGLAVLTVRGAMADDSGKYVVAVENSGGADCHFASISVEGVPEPPTDRPVVSDATSHSLVLAWTGSAYDGGSVITGYAVEMCSLPELRWRRVSGACHSTCYTVRNLLPSRNYVFRVKAENVHGFSDASPESEPIFIRDLDEEQNDGSPFKDQEHTNIVIENGQSIADHYEFMEVVGKGRFGVVHKCLEKLTGEIRAAKVIRCVKQKDKQKMREEVDIMNLLRHPKLLQLVAAFENPKDLILVMEYISGGELFQHVIADDFVLLEKDCVLFLQQICEATRYMHENSIIHLDLKPENILCETKTSHQIKIIDFGLARKFSASESIRVLFGTPEFVAPEVIAYEPVSPASDMWSVGVICYVLLTGLSPFMGDNDAETFANITRADYDFEDDAFDAISSDAKDFIDQLFLKRPEKRLTASACLRHTWLAKDKNRTSVVQLNTNNLKKFMVRRKWQKTGNAIRAIGRMVSLSSPSRLLSTRGSLGEGDPLFATPVKSSAISWAIPEVSDLGTDSQEVENCCSFESDVFVSTDSSGAAADFDFVPS